MKKIYAFFASDAVLKIVFRIFLLVYIIFDVVGLCKTKWRIGNEDKYHDMFARFLKLGYYESAVEGTSLLYNGCLYGIFQFTKNIPHSFLVLNLLSEVFLLVFGCWFCYKISGKSRYFYIVTSFYALLILGMRSYMRASNDTFLGVFVLLLLYFLILKIYDRRQEVVAFLTTGILLGLCIATRITALLLIPLVAIAMVYWIKNTKIEWVRRMVLLLCFAVSTLSVTFAFHYPSIIEHQQLSYESKEPGNGVNWMQRNYIGLKKIENGQEKMHRDAIWQHTTFEEVKDYVVKNGKDSVPDSLTKVMAKDPLLLAKMTIYNLISSLGRFLRFWGFLFFLPFLGLFRTNIFAYHKLPAVLLFCYLLALCAICFSFVEFRWFIGYDILLPVSILLFAAKSDYFADHSKTNVIFTASMILVTLINLKTIIFKI